MITHGIWVGLPAACVIVAVPLAWLGGQWLAVRLAEHVARSAAR